MLPSENKTHSGRGQHRWTNDTPILNFNDDKALHCGWCDQKGGREHEAKKEELKRGSRIFSCVSRESNAGPIDGNDGFYH